jgi:hypothetical protein
MRSRILSWLSRGALAWALSLPGAAAAVTPEDVVRLEAGGYRDEDIIEVLVATRSEFLLSARDVVYLSRAGVGAAVIAHMLVALPLQEDGSGAPVRLKFMHEDLALLAQNLVAEPVIVTFIETREIAFVLDTARLTALRNAGLGLDALQRLVEKSAAAVTLPPLAAPEPAPVLTSGAGAAPYFFGRSGTSRASSGDVHTASAAVVAVEPSLYGYFAYDDFPPVYYAPVFYSPFQGPYYVHAWRPYPVYGYHTFSCPRGPHRHGHDRGGWRDRDHDWRNRGDRDRNRDGDGPALGNRPGGAITVGSGYTRGAPRERDGTATPVFRGAGTKLLYGRSASPSVGLPPRAAPAVVRVPVTVQQAPHGAQAFAVSPPMPRTTPAAPRSASTALGSSADHRAGGASRGDIRDERSSAGLGSSRSRPVRPN